MQLEKYILKAYIINMIDLRVEAWSEEDVYGQQAVSTHRVLNLSAPIQIFMQYNT